MPRKQIDLSVPQSEIRVTATPVAPLREAQVQAPEVRELARLQAGFGGFVKGISAMTDRQASEEGISAIAEIESMTPDELKARLKEGDLEDSLDLTFGTTMALVDARVGGVIAAGVKFSPELTIKLGSDSLTEDEKSSLIDEEIAAYLGDLPQMSNPLHQAGFRQSMAAMKQSMLRDGTRRAAASLEKNTLKNISNSARDAVIEAGVSADDDLASLDGMLTGMAQFINNGDAAVTEGLVSGLEALAVEDPEASIVRAKEYWTSGELPETEFASVTSFAIRQLDVRKRLEDGGRASLKTELREALKAKALNWNEEGTSTATNPAELAEEMIKNPELAAEMAALRAKYEILTDDEWNSARSTFVASIAAEGSRVQAAMYRKNETLDANTHTQILEANGVRSEFDKVLATLRNAKQITLAERIYNTTKSMADARSREKIEGAIGNPKNLSSVDLEAAEVMMAKGETDQLEELAIVADKQYADITSLWKYQSTDTERLFDKKIVVDDLWAQWQSTMSTFDGEPGDITKEFLGGEYDRFLEGLMSESPLSWGEDSREDKKAAMLARMPKRMSLTEDTQTDEWIRHSSRSVRNTELSDDGSHIYKGEPVDWASADSYMGRRKIDFPEMEGALSRALTPGMFTAQSFAPLRDQMARPEFLEGLQGSPEFRRLAAGVIARANPPTLDDYLNDTVGSSLIPGGVALSLVAPLLPGTQSPDISSFRIRGLSVLFSDHESERARVFGKMSDEELEAKRTEVRAKLTETTGLTEANLELALPGLLAAQAGAAFIPDADLERSLIRPEVLSARAEARGKLGLLSLKEHKAYYENIGSLSEEVDKELNKRRGIQ